MVRLDRMAESGSKDFLRTPGRSFTEPKFELGISNSIVSGLL